MRNEEGFQGPQSQVAPYGKQNKILVKMPFLSYCVVFRAQSGLGGLSTPWSDYTLLVETVPGPLRIFRWPHLFIGQRSILFREGPSAEKNGSFL